MYETTRLSPAVREILFGRPKPLPVEEAAKQAVKRIFERVEEGTFRVDAARRTSKKEVNNE